MNTWQSASLGARNKRFTQPTAWCGISLDNLRTGRLSGHLKTIFAAEPNLVQCMRMWHMQKRSATLQRPAASALPPPLERRQSSTRGETSAIGDCSWRFHQSYKKKREKLLRKKNDFKIYKVASFGQFEWQNAERRRMRPVKTRDSVAATALVYCGARVARLQ